MMSLYLIVLENHFCGSPLSASLGDTTPTKARSEALAQQEHLSPPSPPRARKATKKHFFVAIILLTFLRPFLPNACEALDRSNPHYSRTNNPARFFVPSRRMRGFPAVSWIASLAGCSDRPASGTS
jgi:hypothetical protein